MAKLCANTLESLNRRPNTTTNKRAVGKRKLGFLFPTALFVRHCKTVLAVLRIFPTLAKAAQRPLLRCPLARYIYYRSSLNFRFNLHTNSFLSLKLSRHWPSKILAGVLWVKVLRYLLFYFALIARIFLILTELAVKGGGENHNDTKALQ
jgi:hypothetical protein